MDVMCLLKSPTFMEFVKVNVFLLEILSVVDNRIIIKNNQLNVETQALISFATKLVATDQTPAESDCWRTSFLLRCPSSFS